MKISLRHLALVTTLIVIEQARAQEMVVPLDRFDDRLGITIGVNGGAPENTLRHRLRSVQHCNRVRRVASMVPWIYSAEKF